MNESNVIEKKPSFEESFEKVSTLLEGHENDVCILVPDHYEEALMGLEAVKGPDFFSMDSVRLIDTVRDREMATAFREVTRKLDREKYHEPRWGGAGAVTKETTEQATFVLKDLLNDAKSAI